MAHYHLSVPDGATQSRDCRPPFDARIELRQRNGDHPDHRWHVPFPRHDDRVGGL